MCPTPLFKILSTSCLSLDNTLHIDSSGMIRRTGSFGMIYAEGYESPLSTPELARKHLKSVASRSVSREIIL